MVTLAKCAHPERFECENCAAVIAISPDKAKRLKTLVYAYQQLDGRMIRKNLFGLALSGYQRLEELTHLVSQVLGGYYVCACGHPWVIHEICDYAVYCEVCSFADLEVTKYRSDYNGVYRNGRKVGECLEVIRK